MNQYRVLQESKNRFIPQWKGWFFWNGFGLCPYVPEKAFDKREDAETFIKEYIEEHDSQKYPIVVQEWSVE